MDQPPDFIVVACPCMDGVGAWMSGEEPLPLTAPPRASWFAALLRYAKEMAPADSRIIVQPIEGPALVVGTTFRAAAFRQIFVGMSRRAGTILFAGHAGCMAVDEHYGVLDPVWPQREMMRDGVRDFLAVLAIGIGSRLEEVITVFVDHPHTDGAACIEEVTVLETARI